VHYRQCRFRRGSERTVAWIEARGAKLGARVELKTLDQLGFWIVEAVLGAPLSAAALETMHRLNRRSLPGIMNNIV
jgi:hypothetical protein